MSTLNKWFDGKNGWFDCEMVHGTIPRGAISYRYVKTVGLSDLPNSYMAIDETLGEDDSAGINVVVNERGTSCLMRKIMIRRLKVQGRAKDDIALGYSIMKYASI